VEVTRIPGVFAVVNENFVSATVEGTLIMADLAALQAITADSVADILPVVQDVGKAARVMLKKWWCSFGYNFVLASIQAWFCKVTW
jgi:hypothetical protein